MSFGDAWTTTRDWLAARPRVRLALVLGAVVLLGWWIFRPPKFDSRAYNDHQIGVLWRSATVPVDPIAHLQSGKPYNFDPDVGGVDYDQTFLLPLLLRLQDEVHIRWEGLAHKDDPNRLFAVIAPLPIEAAELAELRRIIDEEEEKFPGVIFDQWGHAWLGIDYFTPEESQGRLEEFLERNPSLR